jgi:hypothetical protein
MVVRSVTLALACAGCLSAPVFGVGSPRISAPDPALVARCTSERHTHNTAVIMSSSLAGVAGMGGAAAFVTGTDTAAQVGRVGIAVTALAAGVVSAVMGGVASVADDEYGKDDCEKVQQP